MPDAHQTQKPRSAMYGTFKTVFFAFFGVRKKTDHEEETVRLSPLQIIVAGLIGALLFVVSLVSFAKFIVGLSTA
jgi:uncharacterized membrane protein YqhA